MYLPLAPVGRLAKTQNHKNRNQRFAHERRRSQHTLSSHASRRTYIHKVKQYCNPPPTTYTCQLLCVNNISNRAAPSIPAGATLAHKEVCMMQTSDSEVRGEKLRCGLRKTTYIALHYITTSTKKENAVLGQHPHTSTVTYYTTVKTTT